jgi:hypothetical protein
MEWYAKSMTDEIRQWFVEHEDGEFVVSPLGAAWRVVFPSAVSRTVIYATKYQGIGEVSCQYSNSLSMGLVARYGLPMDEEVQSLRLLVGDRRLLFVGDADPSDLLIFAWLSARLDISYRGLSDSLLKQCGVDLQPRLTLAQSAAECVSHSLLSQFLPDWRGLLGPELSEILAWRRKVEAEVLTGFANVAPEVMLEILLSDRD